MGYLHALLPAGLALASGLELAQAPTPAPGQTALTALDTDRDGSISRGEAQMDPALAAQFPTLDRNANGALEPAEFARFETLGAESTPGEGSPRSRVRGGFAPPPMAPTTTPDANSPPPSPR